MYITQPDLQQMGSFPSPFTIYRKAKKEFKKNPIKVIASSRTNLPSETGRFNILARIAQKRREAGIKKVSEVIEKAEYEGKPTTHLKELQNKYRKKWGVYTKAKTGTAKQDPKMSAIANFEKNPKDFLKTTINFYSKLPTLVQKKAYAQKISGELEVLGTGQIQTALEPLGLNDIAWFVTHIRPELEEWYNSLYIKRNFPQWVRIHTTPEAESRLETMSERDLANYQKKIQNWIDDYSTPEEVGDLPTSTRNRLLKLIYPEEYAKLEVAKIQTAAANAEIKAASLPGEFGEMTMPPMNMKTVGLVAIGVGTIWAFLKLNKRGA